MLEIHDHAQGVRELRLARPPVNALNPALVSLLNSALADAQNLHRAVVLSGQPGLFTGGLDVRELARLSLPEMQAFLQDFLALQRRIASAAVPVVAAITGHSPAGGTVLALFCDHRIMARGAYRIGLNEVPIGLTPGEIIYRSFERLVGARVASDWAMRGVLVESDAALQVGLVDELADLPDVISRAVAYAQELLSLPNQAFQMTRTIARADLVALFDARRCAELLEQINRLWFSEETRQRMIQLLQKAR